MRRSPIFKGKMPFFSVNSPPFLPVSYLSAYQFSSSLVFFFSCFNVGTNPPLGGGDPPPLPGYLLSLNSLLSSFVG